MIKVWQTPNSNNNWESTYFLSEIFDNLCNIKITVLKKHVSGNLKYKTENRYICLHILVGQ